MPTHSYFTHIYFTHSHLTRCSKLTPTLGDSRGQIMHKTDFETKFRASTDSEVQFNFHHLIIRPIILSWFFSIISLAETWLF